MDVSVYDMLSTCCRYVRYKMDMKILFSMAMWKRNEPFH